MEKFNHYFVNTLKSKYADFNGRATRSEYWYFILFYILISIVLGLIDRFVINSQSGMSIDEATQGGFLQFIFALGLLIPMIAIGIRRLHDIEKSGWWLLIGLVPVLGAIVLIYFFVQRSK